MKFRVIEKVHWEVDADNKEEAIEKAQNCEAHFTHSEWRCLK